MRIKKDIVIMLGVELALLSIIIILINIAIKQRKAIKEKEQTIIEREAEIVNIETLSKEEVNPTKYDFIDIQKAVYIEQLSIGLGIDPDLSFAILMVENPEFDENAIHRNDNGTVDEGLFQMNDKYFWTTFRDVYWNFPDIEPNPFNWKHNAYMALHHIKYLQDRLKLEDDVIMAYNGGIGNVINNTVKASTYAYLAKVKNNIWLLKNCKEKE